jgi:Tfp pilus assembly protein PilX
MKRLVNIKNNQKGFIPLLIVIILVVLAVIYFAYLRVHRVSH